MKLREPMIAAGFKGLATEWWHFSLKAEPYPDTYFDFPMDARFARLDRMAGRLRRACPVGVRVGTRA